jgi:hypothetical protein
MTRSKQIKQAQRTRRQIAQLFDALTNDHVNADEILRNVPGCLRRVRAFDVVRRFPHMGGDGANKVFQRAKVWPTTRLGNLTEEERERVIAALPPRVK